MRALGAPRAHVLHVRAQPSRRVRYPAPWPLLACRATPRPRPLDITLQAALQRRRQSPLGGTPASAVRLCHGRRRPSHNSSPAALVSRPSLSPSPSASTDPALAIATSPCRNRSGRPAILSPAAAELTFPGYKWPQASLEHPQASHRVHPPRSNSSETTAFSASGNFGRRRPSATFAVAGAP